MRKLLTMIAFAGTLMAMPAPAQTYSTWESTSGEWSVDSEDGDCLLMVLPPDGRSLGISIDKTSSDFYVRLVVPGAANVPSGQSYPVTLMLDGQRFTSQGRRVGQGKGIGTFFKDQGPQIFRTFTRANRVSVTVESVGSMDLTIDAEAKRQFAKCEAAIGGIGSAPDE